MQCVAHRAFCARVPDGIGDLLVRARLAVGDVADFFPHERLEFGAVDLDGHGEFLELSGEVVVEFAYGLGVSLGGAAADSRFAFGFGVGACLHAARAYFLTGFIGDGVEFQATQLRPFESEGPFAPYVAVVYDCKA